MEVRRLATIFSHLSPSPHPHHHPITPGNLRGADLPKFSGFRDRGTCIENDREDVVSLKLHNVSCNECRVEEVEEPVQTAVCTQENSSYDTITTNTTSKQSEIGSVTKTIEDKQDTESESARMDGEGPKRIDSVGRNNAIVGRNNAMTGGKNTFVEDCIFCLIVQGRSPAFKLYEDEMCICILDVHPLTDGHSLIIPKAHFHSLEFTPPQTHFHIIPRKPGDNLWRSESVCRPMLCVGHETSQLVRKIRHSLAERGP